jgi:alcohol dehydrogenase
MPYVLAFNREAIAEKMVRLAAWLDLPSHDFDGVMDWILDLRVELEIPHALTALGVEEARLDQLAEMAAVDPAGGGNPVPLTVANLRSLLDKAMSGEV